MVLSKEIHKFVYVIAVGMCCLFWSSHAHADDCLRLAEIEAWNEGLAVLNAQISQERWDDSLKTAENLNAICERSPILNYMMGHIYQNMGNDSKALYYMQRATLFTEEFSVKGKTLEQMWFARYEAEHPEARPEAIAKREKEIELLKANAQKTRENAINAQFDEQSDLLAHRSHYAAGLWTGVGIGAAGLALTIAGGVMAFKDKEKKVDVHQNKENKTVAKFDDETALYLGLFGAGIAMTITGTIFMGIFGYHYTHTSPGIEDLAVHIAPNSASLSFNF